MAIITLNIITNFFKHVLSNLGTIVKEVYKIPIELYDKSHDEGKDFITKRPIVI
jgi:hypothetical protein